MQDHLLLLIAQIFVPENVIRGGFTAVGFFGLRGIQFADRRRRSLHLPPERARQTFRRKARRLVIRAFLAGRQPDLWFWFVYVFQRASVKHLLDIVVELRDPADPVFAMSQDEPMRSSLQCDNDFAYLTTEDALDRELKVLEAFSSQIPDSLPHVRRSVVDSSGELAKRVQEVYVRLMSQHAELALDELQRFPKDVADYLEIVVRQESKTVRGRLGCLRQILTRMLEELRQEIRLLIQAHQPPIGDLTSSTPLPTLPHSTEQLNLPSVSQLPNWMRTVLIIVTLGMLLMLGLQIVSVWMLGQ